MNIRLTILMVVVVAIAGGAWAIIEFTDIVSRGEVKEDEPWLYHIDEATITYIHVAHGEESVEYARDSGSHQWRILGDPSYPVFQQKWGGTPLLLSGPRVNRGLRETIDNPADYGLDPPESIVRVADWDGNSFEFHMGIPTPDGDNQYTRLVGDDALYTVPSVWADVVNRLALDPPYGRLFDLELEFITVVEVKAGDLTAIYFLEGNQWLVSEGPPPVDPLLAAPVSEEWPEWLATLAAPRIDEIVEQQLSDRDAEKLAEYGFDNPAVRVVIARRGQAAVEFQLSDGPPGTDSYYARSLDYTDEKLYLMKKSRLEGIEDLASNPLILPGWEPPEESLKESDEQTTQN